MLKRRVRRANATKSRQHEICDRQNLRTEKDIFRHGNLRSLQFASPCIRPHKILKKTIKKYARFSNPLGLTFSIRALTLRIAPILFFGLIGPGTKPLATKGPRQLQDISGNRNLWESLQSNTNRETTGTLRIRETLNPLEKIKNVRQRFRLPNVVLVNHFNTICSPTSVHQHHFTNIICRVCVKPPAVRRYRYTPLDRLDASKLTS